MTDGLRPSARPLRSLVEVDLSRLNSCTPSVQRQLEELGITQVYDLLRTYPRRYLDRTRQATLGELSVGEEATVLASVTSVEARRTRQGRALVEVRLSDGTASLTATFYNQAWRARQLSVGTLALWFGRLTEYRGALQMANPVVDVVGRSGEATSDRMGRIVAVYPLSAKVRLTSSDLGRCIDEALRRAVPLADPLPESLRAALELVDRTTAMTDIHRPATFADRDAARRRLAFDELLLLQLALVLRRAALESTARGLRHVVRFGTDDPAASTSLVAQLLGRLAYQLTEAQHRALAEIFDDLRGPLPMHRLLQGDVGAGKTVVALAAMLAVIDGGHQAALLAPTEILAEQHFAQLEALAAGLEVRAHDGLFELRPLAVKLLTSRTPAGERAALLRGLEAGTVDLVVGTHALLSDTVQFRSLGLGVIDEQHRFGVDQRAVLREKGRRAGDGADPDLLVMTATPIPRTAAMVIFGDLDLTVLDELPAGRQPVATTWAGTDLLAEEAWAALRDEVAAGHQGFVVCPLVEGGKIEAAAVTEELDRLAEGPLRGLRLALLHGQLPAEERRATMEAFRAGELDVVVATTVIEVGVDVPNATVMVILDAARFGIAQLHQLRGRVGRGSAPARCFLLGPAPTPEAARRLEALSQSTDGFELAEVDLELRGEGTILGARQQGRSDLRLASLVRDLDLIDLARQAAIDLVAAHPGLAGLDELAGELRALLAEEEADYLFRS